MYKVITEDDWTIVEVPRANLYNWDLFNNSFGNEYHYEKIHEWCCRNLPERDWTSTMGDRGVKYFYFKDPKYATMFLLRWT